MRLLSRSGVSSTLPLEKLGFKGIIGDGVRLISNFPAAVHFRFLYLMLFLIICKNCKTDDKITLALGIF